MQYLPNTKTLCLELTELVPFVMGADAYDKAQRAGKVRKHGHGGNGRVVLVEFETLPEKYKALVRQHYGDPYTYIARQPLLKLVTTDAAARTYFADYRLTDGRALPAATQQKYTRQAEWLNMIIRVTEDRRTLKETLHITMDAFWATVIEVYTADRIAHGLPTSRRRLDEKLAAFRAGSYPALIDKKWGNQNTRKVDASIEQLLLALYCQFDKPTLVDVCRQYNAFMQRKLHVVDLTTGEAFEPQAYYLKDGSPYEVQPATVKLYVNKPTNKLIVDKMRLSGKEFNDRHRPHMIRKAPFWAFSKITMDDTSSPFKMHNGARPWTYKVFDVASGALIAMVNTKDEIVVGDIRHLLAKLLRMIVERDWVMPHEIEVEHAKNRSMTGKRVKGELTMTDVLTAGAMFPFVHFCAPRSPQEKNAEGFIRGIKDGYQRHREGFQHRPFARRDGWRKNEDAEKVTFSFEEIEAMEQEDAALWNSALHPKQDLYPGLTRWQVLEQCQNPSLGKPNLPLVMPYVGNKTKTSLVRGRIMVQGRKYRLPDAYAIRALNDTKLTAYWLPEDDGDVQRLYLYQDGVYVTEATYESPFQQARAEQTADDLYILDSQRTYREQFDELVDTGAAALPRVGTMPVSTASDAVADEVSALIHAQTTPLFCV